MEDEELKDAEADLIRRASSRLSEILPRRLRFSVLPRPAAQGNQDPGPRSCNDALQVFVRVRPPKTLEQEDTPIMAKSGTQLRVRVPSRKNKEHIYQFSHVFGVDSEQQQVYDMTTAPLVTDLLEYKARCSMVVAYGSSGAGKTHTIEGTLSEGGLLQRTLEQVLKETKDYVSISYYEVYNDVVYDLLEAAPGAGEARATMSKGHLPPLPPAGPPKPKPLRHALLQPMDPTRRALRVREDTSGRVVIPGLTQLPVHALADALDVIQQAARQRQQAITAVNNTSSRSHCVFTVMVSEQQPGVAGRSASLSLVDLAGSERLGRTGNQGERLRESCSINSSLMTLGRCLEALRANQQAARTAGSGGGRLVAPRVVPYRESKITHLFKDVLHGHGHICLLVALSPQAEDLEESLQVLKYAQIALGISLTVVPCAPQAHTTTSAELGQPSVTAEEVEALQARVVELEEELSQVQETLGDTQAAFEAAEADVRTEVVAEVAAVIKELRSSYEEQLKDLAIQLADRNKQVLDLQQLLAERDKSLLDLQQQLSRQPLPPSAHCDGGHMAGQPASANQAQCSQLEEEVQVVISPHNRKGRRQKRQRTLEPAGQLDQGMEQAAISPKRRRKRGH